MSECIYKYNNVKTFLFHLLFFKYIYIMNTNMLIIYIISHQKYTASDKTNDKHQFISGMVNMRVLYKKI